MNSQTTIIAILATAAASLALADDFKTTEGKEYKDATVTRVEPDGLVVKTKSGISKLYFVELPKEVQQRFNYNPQQASAYSSQQAASYEAYQTKQEEAQRQQQAAAQGQPAQIRQQQEQQQEQQYGGGQSTGGRTRPGRHPADTLTVIPAPHEHHEHHEHHEETHSSSKPEKKTH